MPSKRQVDRDDGTQIQALVMSLWDQANDRLSAGKHGDGGGGSLSERNLVDLNLMEVRLIIAETTANELAKRNQTRRPTVPGQLRQLAAYVIGYEPTELWWWEYRFASWARQLGTYLRAYDHEARPVRLRNSPCPKCGARQTIDEGEDGPVVVPPIVIRFRDGYVQAAVCTACNASWFRGDGMAELAADLGVLALSA